MRPRGTSRSRLLTAMRSPKRRESPRAEMAWSRELSSPALPVKVSVPCGDTSVTPVLFKEFHFDRNAVWEAAQVRAGFEIDLGREAEAPAIPLRECEVGREGGFTGHPSDAAGDRFCQPIHMYAGRHARTYRYANRFR